MSEIAGGHFQWQLYDGRELRWSDTHTRTGVCPGCCCGGVETCPDCGGRLHHEPAEGMTPDGWEVVHSQYCEQENETDLCLTPEVREVKVLDENRSSCNRDP